MLCEAKCRMPSGPHKLLENIVSQQRTDLLTAYASANPLLLLKNYCQDLLNTHSGKKCTEKAYTGLILHG